MKKIALLIVFSCFAFSAFSQDDGFQFGFHVSPTITWLNNNADNKAIEGAGSNFAFKIGADGEYYFRENYAIKFGIAMSFNQGGSLVFNSIGADPIALFVDSQDTILASTGNKVNFNYQYLEIPFGLKMRTNEMGSMRYFAEIPVLTLGFNTGSRAKIEDGNDFRIGKDTGLMQISWGLGAGAEYALSESTSVVAGIYFQSGFINTYYGKTGLDSIDDTKTSTNAIEIRIGVLF
jgi:hypothetical protein